MWIDLVELRKSFNLTYAYAKLLNFKWSLEIEVKRCVVKRNLFLCLFGELGEKWQPFKSTGKLKKIALLEHVPV